MFLIRFKAKMAFKVEFLFIITLFTCGTCTEDCAEEVETGLIDEVLNGLEQEDTQVVEAVKSRLIPPPSPNKRYNFSQETVHLQGQFDQVEIVAKLFEGKNNGFFIEAGYVHKHIKI